MAKRQTPQQKRRKNNALMYAGVGVAVIAVTAAVIVLSNVGGPPGPTDSPAPQQAAARIEHIHGLGIDPADGMLYAAAHNGVFQVPATGGAARAGTGVQDTMGFTIAGPKHFLGSGHPAPGQGGPSHLGLIESGDAAHTWQTRSLAGQADFHALRYAHNTVYGYNSVTGQLIVSSDKTAWETRSSLRLRDFVVSPADGDLLLAATATGNTRSADRGRTWTPDGGPPLALLDWPQPDRLWGVTINGEIFTSADGGQNWARTGTASGQPTAFTTNGDTLYLALHPGAIVQSTDRGTTWTTRYQP